jgi:hypothetical protein
MSETDLFDKFRDIFKDAFRQDPEYKAPQTVTEVVNSIKRVLDDFEARAPAEDKSVAAAMIRLMAGDMREKLSMYESITAPSGQRPDESLEEFASRYKSEAERLFEASLDHRVLRLMHMAGTEGENAKWTQSQIFYGLQEAVPGLTKEELTETMNRLAKAAFVQPSRRTGVASVQYRLTDRGVKAAEKDEPPSMKKAATERAKPLTQMAETLAKLEQHVGLLEARLAKVEQVCDGCIYGGIGMPFTPEKLADHLKEFTKSEYGVDLDEPDDDDVPLRSVLKAWGEFELYVRRMFKALGVDHDGELTPHQRQQADFLGLAIRLADELHEAALNGVGPNRNDPIDADFVLSRAANIQALLWELKAPGAIERSGKTIRKLCASIVSRVDNEEVKKSLLDPRKGPIKEPDLEKRQLSAAARLQRVKDTILKVYEEGKVDEQWLEGPTFQAVYRLLAIESFSVSENDISRALEELVTEGKVECICPDPRFDPKYVLVQPGPTDTESPE